MLGDRQFVNFGRRKHIFLVLNLILFRTTFRVCIKRGFRGKVIFSANFTEHGFSHVVYRAQVKDEMFLHADNLAAELAHKLKQERESDVSHDKYSTATAHDRCRTNTSNCQQFKEVA